MNEQLKSGNSKKAQKRGNQSFAATVHSMHPNEVGSLLMRIDRKISKAPQNPKLYFDKGVALIRLRCSKRQWKL